jgi:hypothetical protein
MANQFDPKRTTGAAKGLPGYPGAFKGQLPNESVTRPRFNINPVPVTNGQPAGGQAWAASTYGVQLEMIRYDPTLVSGPFQANFAATIFSPSARLRIAIYSVLDSPTKDASLSYSNAAGGGGRVAGPSGWRLWPALRNPITGKVTIEGPRIALGVADYSNPLGGAGPLPARADPLDFGVAYEADSAASAYAIQGVSMFSDLSSLVIGPTDKVTLKFVVTWEPNCEIPPDELQRLFSKCQIAYGAPGFAWQNNIPAGTSVTGIWSQPV